MCSIFLYKTIFCLALAAQGLGRCSWASSVLAAEHGLQGGTGSVVVALGLSCSMACGIFPDQGLNPCPLHWQEGSLSWSQQGSPSLFLQETGKAKGITSGYCVL